VSNLLPETWRAGAAPVFCDVVVVVVVGRVVVVVVVVVGRVVVVVVVVVVGRVVVVVVGVIVDPPLQATPFTEKLVGAPLLPFQLPMKPGCTDWPLATAPFHASLDTVTFAPDCWNLAIHIWEMLWPSGKPKLSDQLDHASPVLVMVRPPWKPPGH